GGQRAGRVLVRIASHRAAREAARGIREDRPGQAPSLRTGCACHCDHFVIGHEKDTSIGEFVNWRIGELANWRRQNNAPTSPSMALRIRGSGSGPSLMKAS